MPNYEFFMEGPPVSVNAKEGSTKSRNRYRKWIESVGLAAKKTWPPLLLPLNNSSVAVTVSTYHTDEPPDVDNVLKPICDGLKGIVYQDDNQIWRVVSQRFSLSLPLIEPQSDLLRNVLGILPEIVHVKVDWDEEEPR